MRQRAERVQAQLELWADAAYFNSWAASTQAPNHPVLLGWSGLMAIVGFFCNTTARLKGRTANDPPSPDFRHSARRRRRKLDPLLVVMRGASPALLQAEAAGSSAIALAALLREEEADNGAWLRAFERATGAVVFKAPDYIEPRLREARRYAQRDATELRATAAAAVAVAEALRGTPEYSELTLAAVRELDVPRLEVTRLPTSVADFLKEQGAPIAEVDETAAHTEEPPDLTSVLISGAPFLNELAEALEQWEPRFDVRRVRESQS